MEEEASVSRKANTCRIGIKSPGPRPCPKLVRPLTGFALPGLGSAPAYSGSHAIPQSCQVCLFRTSPKSWANHRLF